MSLAHWKVFAPSLYVESTFYNVIAFDYFLNTPWNFLVCTDSLLSKGDVEAIVRLHVHMLPPQCKRCDPMCTVWQNKDKGKLVTKIYVDAHKWNPSQFLGYIFAGIRCLDNCCIYL